MSFVCKANEMLCTFSRSIHISIFLYKVVLLFSTCSPPTLICMYALHNGAFYEQSEPKETKKRWVCGWVAHPRIIDKEGRRSIFFTRFPQKGNITAIPSAWGCLSRTRRRHQLERAGIRQARACCVALVNFLALLIQFSRLLLSSYGFTHFIAVGRKADCIF